MILYKDILNNEKGNVTVIALMMLVILTLIGISASRTSTTDMQIARNEIPHKQDFYISEGGQNREAAFIGLGNHAVIDVETPQPNLASGTHEILTNKTYDYKIGYVGRFDPPQGYSATSVARYDYSINTKGGASNYEIDARYYKIGVAPQ